VMALAVLSHIVTDQMGFMGSNLLFPFTKRRTTGWRLFRSGDAIPNFLSVWICMAIIMLNLDRFSKAPILPPLPYLLLMIVLPCLLFLGLRACSDLKRLHHAGKAQIKARPAVLASVEALDESAEADL